MEGAAENVSMSGVGFTAVGVFIAAFKPTLCRVQAYARSDKLLSFTLWNVC